MACAVLKLSRKGREIFIKIFNILSLILATISFCLVLNSVYITLGVAPSLHSEKAAITLIFTVIGMLAMQLTVYYIAGIFVCHKCHLEAHKKNSRYLLKIWVFSGYSSIINIVVVGTMAAGVSNHLVRSMHHSMIRGMRNYLTDLRWKKIIDTLQFKMQCCGSYDYKDWHDVAWMSIWHFSSFNNTIAQKYAVSGNRVYLPAVPYSCCKLDYPKQCLHDPIQQFQSKSVWDEVADQTINKIGCVEILRQPVENSFLIFILATFVLFLLQILLTIVSRYLYTSFRNAVLLGNPGGGAPGWLFGRGDFGIQRGATVSEIMFGNKRSRRGVPLSSETDTEDKITSSGVNDGSTGRYITSRSEAYTDEEERLLMR